MKLNPKSLVLNVARRVYPFIYWVVKGGRIKGRAFIIRRPVVIRILRGSKIALGRNVQIEPLIRLIAKRDISIGDDVYIGKNATLVAFSELSVGPRTLIAQNVSIHTENHGPVGKRLDYSSAPISIGSDVWIGAGVVITSGVSLGNGVTVGANSVVTKSFGNGVTIAGAPARVITRSPRASDDQN